MNWDLIVTGLGTLVCALYLMRYVFPAYTPILLWIGGITSLLFFAAFFYRWYKRRS